MPIKIAADQKKSQAKILILNIIWAVMYSLIYPVVIAMFFKNGKISRLFVPEMITLGLHILFLFGMAFICEYRKDKEKRVSNLLSAGMLIMLVPVYCAISYMIFKAMGGLN